MIQCGVLIVFSIFFCASSHVAPAWSGCLCVCVRVPFFRCVRYSCIHNWTTSNNWIYLANRRVNTHIGHCLLEDLYVQATQAPIPCLSFCRLLKIIFPSKCDSRRLWRIGGGRGAHRPFRVQPSSRFNCVNLHIFWICCQARVQNSDLLVAP